MLDHCQASLIDAHFYFGHLTNCFPVPFLTGKTKNNKNLSQGMSSQHMETNPNVVLADETNLAVKGSFKTEESGKNLTLLISSIQTLMSVSKFQRQKTLFNLEIVPITT